MDKSFRAGRDVDGVVLWRGLCWCWSVICKHADEVGCGSILWYFKHVLWCRSGGLMLMSDVLVFWSRSDDIPVLCMLAGFIGHH